MAKPFQWKFTRRDLLALLNELAEPMKIAA
jgi:hypothetical protein